MSKITNVFLMLELLESGKIYTISELSKELGVTSRMIRYYKEELEASGIYIESYKGPGGGYFLNKSIYTPYKQFNKYEIQLLEEANKIVNNDAKFKFKKEYDELIIKISNIYRIEEEKSKFKPIFSLEEMNDDDSKKYKFFLEKIKSNERVHIDYLSLHGNYEDRYIHPCYIFKYDNKYYLTAFCELRNAIRHFEFERINVIGD